MTASSSSALMSRHHVACCSSEGTWVRGASGRCRERGRRRFLFMQGRVLRSRLARVRGPDGGRHIDMSASRVPGPVPRRLASRRPASPRLASPRPASRRLAPPRLASSGIALSRIASSRFELARHDDWSSFLSSVRQLIARTVQSRLPGGGAALSRPRTCPASSPWVRYCWRALLSAVSSSSAVRWMVASRGTWYSRPLAARQRKVPLGSRMMS